MLHIPSPPATSLPGWVKVVCVDINPRRRDQGQRSPGTGQAIGIVTDVGQFLGLLNGRPWRWLQK